MRKATPAATQRPHAGCESLPGRTGPGEGGGAGGGAPGGRGEGGRDGGEMSATGIFPHTSLRQFSLIF